MIVRFGIDLDGNPWPGPLGARSAVAGEPWVGPSAFLDLLETQLGLTGLRASGVQRAAAIVPAVQGTDGFWSKSAKHDPLGVAGELLRWRDALCMAGWDGEPVERRLAELAEVTADAPPGRPDRLRAVITALAEQRVDIDRVLLLGTAMDELEVLWQRLLEKLAEHGVTVETQPVAAACTTGDLAACLAPDFAPTGDGSLVLLRPEGPLTAAEQVAAWLAAQSDLAGTVIVNADEQLDHALYRRGLPTTGVADASSDDALLQVLPLVLELAWAPQDPAVAHELLMLAKGPVPRGMAFHLMRALRDWPAVDSDKWRERRAAGLAEIEGDARRERVAARLDAIFTPASTDDVIATAAVRARVDAIMPWLRGNADAAEPDVASRWTAAIAQGQGLLRLLEATGADELSRSALRQLVAAATADAPRQTPFDARAGLHPVRRPGGVLGPARRVVWWNFTRATAGVIRPLPLDADERTALAGIGVVLPDPGQVAESRARRWRHPFLAATETLLLVAPQRGAAGEPAHPHPVWDEVTASLDDAAIARIALPEPLHPAREHMLPPLARTMPTESWTLTNPEKIEWPERYSPSSANGLIGCPLQWVLKRAGKLSSGESATLPEGPLLFGNLAHHVLEVMLATWQDRGLQPVEAAALAVSILDRDGARLAAALFQPGQEPQLDDVRTAIKESAFELVRQLNAAGARLEGTEQKRDGTCQGMALRGIADVLLAEPRGIVDIKWGSGQQRRDDLKYGAASQLAVYASLYADGGPPAAVAYFIITRQAMYTNDKTVWPLADAIEGPSMADTLAGFRVAVDRRIAEVKAGVVEAPGALLEDLEKELKDMPVGLHGDALALAPGCRYCDFTAMCRGGDL